jgi:hypothetical protein
MRVIDRDCQRQHSMIKICLAEGARHPILGSLPVVLVALFRAAEKTSDISSIIYAAPGAPIGTHRATYADVLPTLLHPPSGEDETKRLTSIRHMLRANHRAFHSS